MGLFQSAGHQNVKFYPFYNTGTFLDIATATAERGTDGKWLINGGLPPLLGIIGRSGYFKSTVADAYIVNSLLIYPGSEASKHDTENNSFSSNRFKVIAENSYLNENKEDIVNRISFSNSSSMSQNEYIELLKNVFAQKEKHKKDYMVESPFVDPETGKNLLVWVPTIVDIDSFSWFRSTTEVANAEKLDLDDTKRKTEDMNDGSLKKKLLIQFSQWAYKYGVIFILTGQVDNKFDLDPYKPTVKQNSWLKNTDAIKGCSNQFHFLTNTLLQCYSPSPILASDKKSPQYTSEGSAVDINKLEVRMLRCKTNSSGNVIPYVASQSHGIVPGLTNYQYLVDSNDFGFNVNGYRRTPVLSPDYTLSRTNVMDTLKGNYELNRALEILAQLKWINDNWSLGSYGINIPKTAQELIELIAKSNTIMISDILNSRGYWTYDKNNKRPYMSIFDICELLQKS